MFEAVNKFARWAAFGVTPEQDAQRRLYLATHPDDADIQERNFKITDGMTFLFRCVVPALIYVLFRTAPYFLGINNEQVLANCPPDVYPMIDMFSGNPGLLAGYSGLFDASRFVDGGLDQLTTCLLEANDFWDVNRNFKTGETLRSAVETLDEVSRNQFVAELQFGLIDSMNAQITGLSDFQRLFVGTMLKADASMLKEARERLLQMVGIGGGCGLGLTAVIAFAANGFVRNIKGRS